MRFTMKLLVIATLIMIGSQSRSAAAFITYTETVTGSGSLGGTAFTNAAVTLTATADSVNIQSNGRGLFTILPSTATVTVAGLGSGSFTSSTFNVGVNQLFDGGTAVFGDTSQGTVLGVTNPVFATYLLTAPFGPVSGTAFIRPDLTFATTGGGFILSSVSTQPTFTATAAVNPVPAPAGLLLALIGLPALGLAGSARRQLPKMSV